MHWMIRVVRMTEVGGVVLWQPLLWTQMLESDRRMPMGTVLLNISNAILYRFVSYSFDR